MMPIFFENDLPPERRMALSSRYREWAARNDGMEFGAVVPFREATASRTSHNRVVVKSARNLVGYATRYNKVHLHKGRLEIFRPGVFAKSLLDRATVRLLDAHDEAKCLATTNGGGLELLSDGVGLAFSAHVSDEEPASAVYDAVASGQKRGMSVGYTVLEEYDQIVAGETVHMITAARLSEVSIVEHGAVPQAYVEMSAESGVPRLSAAEADCRSAANKVSRCFFETMQALGALSQ